MIRGWKHGKSTSVNSYHPIKGSAPLVMNFLHPDSDPFANERESAVNEFVTSLSNKDGVTMPMNERNR